MNYDLLIWQYDYRKIGQQYLIKIQMIEYKFGTVNLHIHASQEITAVTQTKVQKCLNIVLGVACRLRIRCRKQKKKE